MLCSKRDTFNAFSVCFVLLFEQINYAVHSILKFVGLSVPFVTMALLGCMLSLLALQLAMRCRNMPLRIVVPFLAAGAFFVSYFALGENGHHLADSVSEKFFLYCLPAYAAVLLIRNYDAFYAMIRKFCYLIIVSQVFAIYALTYAPGLLVSIDYQGISYHLMIPFVLLSASPSRTKKDLVLVGVILVLMVFFGGRGPLLCSMSYILYRMLRSAERKKEWILAIIVLMMVVALGYQMILESIINIAAQYGFIGGISTYAALGNIFSDSGRFDIYQKALNIWLDHPLLGCGLGSTRYYLGAYGFRYGNYPHSIILELLCDYGVLLGVPMMVILAYRAVEAFQYGPKCDPGAMVLFEMCFFSSGCLILIFSSSYVTSQLFWAMLAVMPVLTKKRSRKRSYAG